MAIITERRAAFQFGASPCCKGSAWIDAEYAVGRQTHADGWTIFANEIVRYNYIRCGKMRWGAVVMNDAEIEAAWCDSRSDVGARCCFLKGHAQPHATLIASDEVREIAKALAMKEEPHCTCDAPEGCVWYEHTADCDMYEHPDP